MAIMFKQNTSGWLTLGPFVGADGWTPATALTLTVYLSKNGLGSSARNEATAVAHDRDGYYRVKLNSTDLNTAGRLIIHASNTATAVGAYARAMVMSSRMYDCWFGTSTLIAQIATGTSNGQLDTTGGAVKISTGTGAGQLDCTGGTVKVSSGSGAGQILLDAGKIYISTGTGAGQLDTTGGKIHAIADSIANNAITAAALATDAIAEIWDHTLESTVTGAGMMRIMFSALAGPTSGAGTTTIKFMDLTSVKDRITMSVNSSGERDTITLDTSS